MQHAIKLTFFQLILYAFKPFELNVHRFIDFDPIVKVSSNYLPTAAKVYAEKDSNNYITHIFLDRKGNYFSSIYFKINEWSWPIT